MKQAEQHQAQGRGVRAIASATLDDMGVECKRRVTLPLESIATSARIVEHRGAGGLARVIVCSKCRGA